MKNRQVPIRLFTLIRRLNTRPYKTAKGLIASLGYTSKTTFYDDIKFLKEIGYPIQSNKKHQYLLDTFAIGGGSEQLAKEEKDFLQDLLQRHAASNPHAEMLLHKFRIDPTFIPVADALPQLHASRIIRLIKAGIEMEKCLVLKKYRSLSGGKVTINDRKIEPLELTLDYRFVLAWDLDKGGNRQFKINRIADVDILEQAISGKYFAAPLDIFGLTSDGNEWLPVRLLLSNLAFQLMIEEFPLSRNFIRKTKKGQLFDGVVRHFKGIGRFVLSLPGEVEVLETDAFKAYLKERAAKASY